MSASPPGLTVVIPAFNLEAVIAHTVAALREELRFAAPMLEFVIVDDGSSDGTAAAVASLCHTFPDVRLLRNRRNLGKGMSVYLGLLAARYSLVCFTDGDLPFSRGSYRRLAQHLFSGHEFVIASRRLQDSEIVIRMQIFGYTIIRHIVGLTFNRLVRTALGLPYRDTQCGLKGFKRDVAIELFRRVYSPRFLFDIELLLAAQRTGTPVEQIPASIEYSSGNSSVKLTGDSAKMFVGLAKIAWRHRSGGYCKVNPLMEPDAASNWAEEVMPKRLATVTG